MALALLSRVHHLAEGSTTWVDLGGLRVTLGYRLDGVAVLVAAAVAAVALAVQVYSVAYLRRGPHDDIEVDHRYPPYAAQISLFTAAMLLVVVTGDLIMLLVGWEVMGICSYLLIAHDRRLPEAPARRGEGVPGDPGRRRRLPARHRAARRLAPAASGSPTCSPTPLLDRRALTAACLLLLAGVAGKSAQFPLHTWLPDAMAGPTPISALIHAATMVAAGVYVGGPAVPAVRARPGGAGRARRAWPRSPCCSARSPPPPRTTSSGCWPGRRCPSSAT